MSHKSRVVLVTYSEPYPFGDAVGKWYHALIKGLTARGHQVRCLSVLRNRVWAEEARKIFGTEIELSFYDPRPPSVSNISQKLTTIRQPYSHDMSDELRKDLNLESRKGYDILQLEHLWFGYLTHDARRTLTSIHHLELLDLHGIWSANWHFLKGKALMSSTERRLIRSLTHIRATTDRLARAAAAINPTACVSTVPLAIDPDTFRFQDGDRPNDPVIGFLGSMHWSPGALAAIRLITRVFPAVKARVPEARLLVGGWSAATVLAKYAHLPDVEIVDNVPEARAFLDRLQVLVYPLPQGSGMMTKILEAMAYGVPVATTTEGAEGFAIESGTHAIIDDDDESLADAIARVLQDAQLRSQLRTNARRLVEDRYSPTSAVAALERVYDTM